MCIITRFGHIAQLVEQGTENPCVPSSILGVATIFISRIRLVFNSAFFITSQKRDTSKRTKRQELELESFQVGQTLLRQLKYETTEPE